MVQMTDNVHDLQAIPSTQPKQRGHGYLTGHRLPDEQRKLSPTHTQLMLPGLSTSDYQVKILFQVI